MFNINKSDSMTKSPSRILFMSLWLVLVALVSGCASTPEIPKRDKFLISIDGIPDKPKSIFIFLDGTANDESSSTNVWRLFNEVKKHKNQQTIGRYIPGVGSVKEPLEEDPILPIFGDGLGMGMQARILDGYDFLVENYNTGDEIFIFGFSRGAHQARALAGLVSYVGIPKSLEHNAERKGKLERILKLLKNIRDEEMKSQWEAWTPNQPPLLAQLIKSDSKLKLDMQGAEVKLLGVWDTVPGSSFKDYDACKEKIGFAKTYLYWLPIISKGERYKSDSYPPIRQIAHALSADENRSKFSPLFLCKAIKENSTRLNELWFPGAHADVGGGYGDNDLPDISLTWMVELLDKNYKFSSKPDVIKGRPTGLAHWSLGDEPGNTGSDCEGRLDNKDRQPPLGYNPDLSIEKRKEAGLVPIAVDVNGLIKQVEHTYPIPCPGFGK